MTVPVPGEQGQPGLGLAQKDAVVDPGDGEAGDNSRAGSAGRPDRAARADQHPVDALVRACRTEARDEANARSLSGYPELDACDQRRR